MNEATSKAIAAERSAAHLTIKELAKKANLNERTLIRLLQNERNINVIQLAQLAEVFGVYPHELIESAERFIERSERGPVSLDTDSGERPSVDIDDLSDRIAAHPEQFDLASNIDPHKEDEMNTPRE
ncbi:helix-turn-helix transcriptional regulator [Bifidobacterium saguini]|nr:helix-turn-helix transcriptional regulator [Bifidobacterium saguini]QTB90802.1 helix-turn-helix transcriptional regulator [Bifidobacterium saguini]QTB90864.1 helix-turn-helix transcriptional regulator [Bifidobacterium saguini]